MGSATDYASLAWGFTLWNYLSGVGLTVLTYDHFLTLDDEIHLVWPGALSFPKVLFYSIRYLSLITLVIANYGSMSHFRPPVPVRFCQLWFGLGGVAFLVRYTAATGMLCMRLHALYKGSRWVVRPLWAMFVICFGIRSVFLIWASSLASANAEYDPMTNQCYSSRNQEVMGAVWFAAVMLSVPTSLDLFILILTMIKAISSATLPKSHPSSPIMRALVRHELLYFFFIVALRIANSTFWFAFPQALKSVFDAVEWSVEVALISRFFLNLRSVYHASQPKEESGSLPSVVRTGSIWSRRMNGFITEFSAGLEEEPSTRGDIPHAQTVDLHVAPEMRTRHDGDEESVKVAANFTPVDDK